MRSLNLFPDDFCRRFQALAARYWPVLFILGGIKILVRGNSKTVDWLIGLLIVILAALWVVCKWVGHSDWLNV
ncbi:MAG: hypothetical protein PVG90_05465 [Bacillota bacterium]